MPHSDRSDESGRFTPKFADDEFIDAVSELGEATTREVAEQVGADHDTARRRLTRLSESDDVCRRKVGNTILWSLVNDGAGSGQ